MQHTTCNMQPTACNMQPTACNMQPMACNMRHTTCNMRHTACNMRHTACNMAVTSLASGSEAYRCVRVRGARRCASQCASQLGARAVQSSSAVFAVASASTSAAAAPLCRVNQKSTSSSDTRPLTRFPAPLARSIRCNIQCAPQTAHPSACTANPPRCSSAYSIDQNAMASATMPTIGAPTQRSAVQRSAVQRNASRERSAPPARAASG